MTTPEKTIHELFDLRGKVALVTGAAGHLGSAIARALAEAGATLVATSRDARRAESAAAGLPGNGHLAVSFQQDDTDSIPALVRDIVARLGRIDVLVNNAYGGAAPDIDNASADDFDRSFHTGVTSYFLLAREIHRHLRERGRGGSIINIASMYGVVASYPEAYVALPVNSPPNYHALKGGLVHLTRHLAAYWAQDNVRVNAISPGPFPKQAIQQSLPAFIERLNDKTPVGRMGRPEELKGAVVLLASDAGSYITGHNLLVDGGWTCW